MSMREHSAPAMVTKPSCDNIDPAHSKWHSILRRLPLFGRFLGDRFVQNSMYIIVANLLSTGFGFIFWILAAKVYAKDDVGIATALLSSVSLVIIISRLGLEQCLIRFFPQGDKKSILSTTAVVTTLFSVILAIGFLIVSALTSSGLWATADAWLAYILVVIITSLTSVYGVTMNAMRSSRIFFWQNLMGGTKIPLMFLFIPLGAMGLFISTGLGLLLSLLISLAFFQAAGLLGAKVDLAFLRSKISFSSGNYISTILMTAPSSLLPIMVLGMLSPSEAANFYMAFTAASILFMLPSAISTILYVEGSHGESMLMSIMKTIKLSLLLLLPSILVVIAMGQWFLGLIGEDYASGGYVLLVLLSISSLFTAAFNIFITIKNDRPRYKVAHPVRRRAVHSLDLNERSIHEFIRHTRGRHRVDNQSCGARYYHSVFSG